MDRVKVEEFENSSQGMFMYPIVFSPGTLRSACADPSKAHSPRGEPIVVACHFSCLGILFG